MKGWGRKTLKFDINEVDEDRISTVNWNKDAESWQMTSTNDTCQNPHLPDPDAIFTSKLDSFLLN